MKTKVRFLQLLIMVVFTISMLGTRAQTSQTTTQTVCVGNQPYRVDPIAGATFVWSVTGGIPADYQINGSGNSITVDWNIPGVYVLSVYSYIVISCPGITQSVTVTVVPQPIGPTLNVKTPNLLSVCSGTDVSATFIAGSGGVGCSDAFEYRFNGGAWTTYNPGVNLSTTGHTLVEIQGQRSGCTLNAGCSGTSWVTLASWIVNPNLPVSVSIVANQNNVCATTSVTYTATPINGGTTPVYAWYVNGTVQVGTSATFSYVPANGDAVHATLTSNATCATGSPATSNTVTMTINPLLPVSISIVANQNNVCATTSVTYTATPINGGTTPVYAWYVNGTVQVGTSATFSYVPANGDVVHATLTSNATCATGGSPATSGTVTMTINPLLPVSVSIVANQNNVCATTSVTYTATPINGGTTPVYAWYVNGTVQVGTSATFSYVPANGDAVHATLTSNATCATGSPATSNTVTMTINPLLPVSVSIVANQNNICATTSVTYTATPINGGTTPVYAWYVNGAVQVGTSATFSYVPANGDVVHVTLTSNATCATGGSPATSNTVTMTINPLLPVSVSIVANQNNICATTSVTYTATPINGGTTPVYAWYVNGTVQVGTSATFSYVPVNGDAVYSTLTSNAICATGSPATSNTVTMTINPLLPVSVSIVANQNNICATTSVTYTATPINGGTTPVYAWYVNGTVQVGTSATFSYVPANGDAVYATLTSNAICATGSPAISNTVTMTINPLLPVSVSIVANQNNVCAATSVTYTATPINGGTTPVYAWYVNGTVQVGTSATFSYVPATGDAVHATLTSNATCATGSPATSNTVTMTINPIPTTSPIWHN